MRALFQNKTTGTVTVIALTFATVFIVLQLIPSTPIKQVDVKSQREALDVPFQAEGSVYITSGTDTLATFQIEVANTETEIRRGLMYRTKLEKSQAMLFDFPQTQVQTFWMRNTYMPLDILFFDDAGILVDAYTYTVPYSDEKLPSRAEAKYALEINAGLMRDLELEKGNQVHISLGE